MTPERAVSGVGTVSVFVTVDFSLKTLRKDWRRSSNSSFCNGQEETTVGCPVQIDYVRLPHSMSEMSPRLMSGKTAMSV
jgi:hypothetical protein